MSVSFGGIGELAVTFENSASGGAAAGKAVKMSGNGCVAVCGNGERFIGWALAADGKAAAVQLRGFATVGYSGTAPSVGWARLVSDAEGKVKTDAGSTGVEYLVASVDTAAKTAVILL